MKIRGITSVLAVAFPLIICVICVQALTADDAGIRMSVDRVIAVWEKQLFPRLDIVREHIDCQGRYHFWDVRRLVLAGAVSSGFKKSTKNKPPLRLTLKINARFADNTAGPGADSHYIKRSGRYYGYKTATLAMGNRRQSDFTESDRIMTLKIHYELRQNAWHLNGGNELFKTNILKHKRHNHSLMAMITKIDAGPRPAVKTIKRLVSPL